MITVYQITLTDAEIDEINAGQKVEKYDVRNRMMFGFNKEKWGPEAAKFYTKSYEIHTDNLEYAFRVTNLWDDPIAVRRINEYACSTSVGDIFVLDGIAYMVDTFGFAEIGEVDFAE